MLQTRVLKSTFWYINYPLKQGGSWTTSLVCLCNHILLQSLLFWKYIKVCGYSDPFFENLNQRSLTPRWPLTPCLLRSHVWLYPRIIVSSPMGIHQCMWIQWSILQNYHILSTYIHTTYILCKEWVITQSLTELSSGETKTEVDMRLHHLPFQSWFKFTKFQENTGKFG